MLALVITTMAWLAFLSAVISILRLAVTLLVREASPAVVVPLALYACGLSLLALVLVIRRRSM